MMLGEMDFVGTYVQPFYTNQLTFPLPAFILLGIKITLIILIHYLMCVSPRRSLYDSDANSIDESAHRFGRRRH